MKNKKIFLIIVAILAIGLLFLVFNKTVLAPKNNNQTTKSSGSTKYSLTDPDSIWVVINKQRPLPQKYIPANLVIPNITLNELGNNENMKINSFVVKDLENLVGDAKKSGFDLELVSGYRSYVTQNDVYNNEVKVGGVDHADKISARPGYSEHQTGLAMDLGRTDGYCTLVECFGDTKEGKWLAENAYKYGFVIRYQKGKQSIVGYEYEPWHLRYVSKDLAEKLHKSNQTMEEFFNLPVAPNY